MIAGFAGVVTEQVQSKNKFVLCVSDVHMSPTVMHADIGLDDSVDYPTNSDCQLANITDDLSRFCISQYNSW